MNPALAFKLKTHVWIGQEVWNDVNDDGYVTIPPYGSYKVATDIVTALKNNRRVYLMGNVGPDGFPDMIGGQVAVHPGIPDGWKTDDWFKHMLKNASSSSEKAFAYGYLSHGAADTFAHTYVNTYAGDAFDMMDGETDVEARHMRLEAYIEDKTPDLSYLDSGARPRGVATGKELPLDYLMRTLIMGDDYSLSDVTRQYMKIPAGTTHLQFMNDYETAIWATEQAVDVFLLENSGVFNAALRAYDKVKKKVPLELINNAQLVLWAGAQACETLVGYSKSSAKIGSTTGGTVQTKTGSNPIEYTATKTGPNTQRVVFQSKWNDWVAVLINPTVAINVGTTVAATQVTVDIIDRIDSRILCLANTTLCVTYHQAQTAVNAYCERSQELADAHEEFTIFLSNYALAYAVYGELGLLKIYLRDLQLSSRAAASSYIDTSSQIVELVLTTKGSRTGSEALKLISNWANCDGLVYLGVEQHISSRGCSAAAQIFRLVKNINSAQTKLNNLFIKYPLQAIGIKYPDIQREIYDKLAAAKENLGKKIIEKVTGPQVQQLMEIALSPSSPTLLNSQFMTNNSNKGLLLVDDVSGRVDKEMQLTRERGRDIFNKDEYAVIYNSILLSKLSLLDGAELNRLAFAAGVTDSTAYPAGVTGNTTYGSKLFPETAGYNILFDAIKTIDGNHQWLVSAPPYPRVASKPDTALHNYGYANDGYKGFRMYQDSNARKKLFNTIFKGPLVPGIEMPATIGYKPVLPSNYQYIPCSTNYYPNGINDQSCVLQ